MYKEYKTAFEKVFLEGTEQAQERAYRHHDTCLRCQKCENYPYCHEYIDNCGSFVLKESLKPR